MVVKHFPFIRPTFPSPEEISEDFSEIVKRNYYTNSGPVENDLANKISDYIGGDIHTSLMNNATTALILAVKLLFDPSKKYVPMQSFTFVAGAQAIRWCGFEPVFIDINEDTWQPSADSLHEALDKYENNVAGVLLCNSFGTGNTDIDKLLDICRKLNVSNVVDSAAGLGSKYDNNTNVGTKGDCEVFSMHATKPFAIGEAGAVTSNNPKLIKQLNEMKNFGFDESKQAVYPGLNGKLPELLASIGIRQLQSLDKRLLARRKSYLYYKELLEAKSYSFQTNSDNSSLPFVSALAPTGVEVGEVINRLNSNNIDARNYYNPIIHVQPSFKDCARIGDLANTQDISSRILSLPLYDSMDRSDISYICNFI